MKRFASALALAAALAVAPNPVFSQEETEKPEEGFSRINAMAADAMAAHRDSAAAELFRAEAELQLSLLEAEIDSAGIKGAHLLQEFKKFLEEKSHIRGRKAADGKKYYVGVYMYPHVAMWTDAIRFRLALPLRGVKEWPENWPAPNTREEYLLRVLSIAGLVKSEADQKRLVEMNLDLIRNVPVSGDGKGDAQ